MRMRYLAPIIRAYEIDLKSSKPEKKKQNSNAMHNRSNERCHQVGEIPLMRWLTLITTLPQVSLCNLLICRSVDRSTRCIHSSLAKWFTFSAIRAQHAKINSNFKNPNWFSHSTFLLSYSNGWWTLFALRCFVGWSNMCPACVCVAMHGTCLPACPPHQAFA